MNVNDIDEKIKEISKEDLDQGNLLYLMVLIENKLNTIFEPIDLLPFSSLIQILQLSNEQKKKIIHFRNKLAHNIVSKEELVQIELYLKSEFIPLILSISSDSTQMKPYEFENLIYNKLKPIGDELGYEVIRNKSISIEKKKTRLEIDVIFESEAENIIFEIKAIAERNIIPIVIDQVKTRLNILKSRFGVIILKGFLYEELKEDNISILIIGDMQIHKLLDWIKKINNEHNTDTKNARINID